jgi:hypothetical protein
LWPVCGPDRQALPGMRDHLSVVSPANRDWFRSPTWNAEIETNFDARLARARPAGRAQYLRVQATHLLASPDKDTREAGRQLLRRVLSEYPDSFEAKFASEQLGDSLANDGQLGAAEQALRETLRLCAASPIGRSGTSGTPELRLAEVILAGADHRRLDEAAALLAVAEPDVRQQAIMRNVVFRFLLASARVAHLRRDPAAIDIAREALAVAAETSPSIPRHSDVGRPSATAAQLAELERIVGPD